MDDQNNEITIKKPRRRRKTRMEIIKEAYLPYIFLMIAAVFIVVCIIGAIIRSADEQPPEDNSNPQAAISQEITLL